MAGEITERMLHYRSMRLDTNKGTFLRRSLTMAKR